MDKDKDERIVELEGEVKDLTQEVKDKDTEIERLLGLIREAKDMFDEIEGTAGDALRKAIDGRDTLKNE